MRRTFATSYGHGDKDMNAIEWTLLVGAAPVFVYVVFRAAASGWFGVKHYYQRRLVDGIRKGDPNG